MASIEDRRIQRAQLISDLYDETDGSERELADTGAIGRQRGWPEGKLSTRLSSSRASI